MLRFVYLIRRKTTTHYKIGIARNPQSRLKAFQTASPEPLHIVASVQCEHPERVENRLHKRLRHKQIGGEWFDLTDQEAQEIAWWFDAFSPPKPKQNKRSRTGWSPKQELARRWFEQNPESLDKTGRELENTARPQGVKISYRTWNDVKRELKEKERE